MNKEKDFAKSLMDFIQESPSSFHATSKVEEVLIEKGFKEIKLEDQWNLQKEGKYYIVKINLLL